MPHEILRLVLGNLLECMAVDATSYLNLELDPESG